MADNGRLPDSMLAPIKLGRLRKDAAAAFNAMNVEARRSGVVLHPTGSKSSYRDMAGQQYFWNLYLSGKGNLAARPGNSNHGWGLAVDLATPAMRAMVDRIGAKYGWAKKWSDAPSEWWHVKWREGVWQGQDPGPDGHGAVAAHAPALEHPTVEEGEVAIAIMKLPDGRNQIIVQNKDDSIWTTWQAKEGGWAGSVKGKRVAGWQSMGTPGKK